MTDQQKQTAEEIEEMVEEPVEAAEETLTEEEKTEELQEEPCEEAPEEKPEEPEEDWKDKYTRLYAEFQNFRKRTDKEKSDIYAFANEKFAMGLLEVIDNFERAMEHAQDSSDPKFAEGMQLILKQLQGVLVVRSAGNQLLLYKSFQLGREVNFPSLPLILGGYQSQDTACTLSLLT